MIVAAQILYVLKQECLWLMLLKNLNDVEKQRTLGFVEKSVCATEAVFLRYAREAEGLTWEAGEQQIMCPNFTGSDLRDVSSDVFRVRDNSPCTSSPHANPTRT